MAAKSFHEARIYHPRPLIGPLSAAPAALHQNLCPQVPITKRRAVQTLKSLTREACIVFDPGAHRLREAGGAHCLLPLGSAGSGTKAAEERNSTYLAAGQRERIT